MSDPEFILRDPIRRENVRVFSSNYALYGDLSRRVGDSLHSLLPTVETYLSFITIVGTLLTTLFGTQAVRGTD